jgi:type IV secretory pathway TrbF-like protein
MRILRRSRPPQPREVANPILAGRGAFAGAFGDLARAKRSWQVVALGLLAVLGVVAVGYVRLAEQARITPYVIQVDKLGRAVAVGPAERTVETDPRVVEAALSLFVRNVRAVSSDAATERELLFRAYAHVLGRARDYLDGYFALAEHDPRVLGQSLTRAVEIEAILPVPSSSVWRVQWTEHDQPVGIGTARDSAWEGYFTVTVRRSKVVTALEENPLGIYVSDMTWTEILKRTKEGGATR